MEDEDLLHTEDETNLRGHRGTGFVLVVAAPGTTVRLALPASGTVIVGRGLDVNLRVPLPDMSRRHLSFRWEDRELQVADLGSSNGTVLRGVRLVPQQWRPIALGELLLLGDAALAVHEGNPTDAPRHLVGDEAFESALEAQLRTHSTTSRPFGVCAIEVDEDTSWTDFVVGLLGKKDSVAYLSSSSLRLLLVDRTAPQLDVVGEFLDRSLASFSPARKVVMHACPRDGDTLPALYGPALYGAARQGSMRVRARDAVARETRRPPSPIVRSAAMTKLYALVDEVARTPTSILILGETGVGKDVLARALHERSDRANAPFVGLNCAALPESLLESELFGYERGAFTGAVASKPGLLESAEGGTVFLDEIGEMPASTQAKLLRVLEERKVLRVGGLKAKRVDFRLLAATNRNLQAEIAAGRFRADLFYRINGLALSIPPLRERREEIASLSMHFAENAAATLRRPVPLFSPETLSCFDRYSWPGNIRELRSVVERAVLLARHGTILLEHLPDEIVGQAASQPPPSAVEPMTHPRLPALFSDEDEGAASERSPPQVRYTMELPPPPTVRQTPPSGMPASGRMSLRSEVERLEYERIVQALQEHGGNQTRAAEALGLTRRALIVRLERYQLPRPRKARGGGEKGGGPS